MRTLFLLLPLLLGNLGWGQGWADALVDRCEVSADGSSMSCFCSWGEDTKCLPVVTRHPRIPLLEPTETSFTSSIPIVWPIIQDYRSVLVESAIKEMRQECVADPTTSVCFDAVGGSCPCGYHHESRPHFTCKDAGRVLLTSEDGKNRYCVKF